MSFIMNDRGHKSERRCLVCNLVIYLKCRDNLVSIIRIFVSCMSFMIKVSMLHEYVSSSRLTMNVLNILIGFKTIFSFAPVEFGSFQS